MPAGNDFEGHHTVRIYNLLVHGALYEQIPVAPDRAADRRGRARPRAASSRRCRRSRIDPGETAQPIHADDQLIPLPKPHPPLVCNTMWALTDFTEENGATRIVPGLAPVGPRPRLRRARTTRIPAEMPKGSVLIWHGSLWHGGGANRTDERRVGIAMNYCAGYVRQQENQQLGIPRDIARGFPPRLRELVGYGVYNGLIGHIDKHDPIELLDQADEPGHSAHDVGTTDHASDTHKMVWDVV